MGTSTSQRVEVLIGLGANLGDRRKAVERALEAVDELPETDVVDVSELYETEARFVERQPDFINACARLKTAFEPRPLLDSLLAVERAMGRVRDVDKGPRIIDLDILFYCERVVDERGLTIPHPDLHNRRFVLEPLSEIAADFVHPVFGETVAELRQGLSTQ